MTFNNKQELIDFIKEKQASVKRDLEKLPRRRTIRSEKLVSTIRAYEYVIDLIDSAKIVVYPEEMGIGPCETAPKEEEHEIYSIDNNMKKKFLEAVNNHGSIRTMNFFVGYPPKWVSIKTEDMCQAILKDVEELEEKKNENGMPIEAYENRIKASNETISRLLKENKDYGYTIDKLQRVIVAQALRIVELQKGIVKLETTSK